MKICILASSSAGNSSVVSDGETNILIDAGISMTRIKKSLVSIGMSMEEISGILVTHDHWDHIGGLKMLLKYYDVPTYATEGVAKSICRLIPKAERCVNVFSAGDAFDVGDFSVSSFQTPHDASGSVGYVLRGCGGKTAAYVTDLGWVTQEIYDAVLGADIAIIEANHDVDMLKNGQYPYHLKKRILSKQGHMSNELCGKFAAALAEQGTKQFILAHLSEHNNTPQTAYTAVCSAFESKGMRVGEDVKLYVAPAREMSGIYIV